VIFIGSQVDPATGTVLARLAVPKTAGLRPGQFVQARLFSEELKDRLAVPVASVVTDPEEGSVIAIVEAGKATRRKVKTGLRDGDLIEVEGEGVVEGQNVVTVGAYGLPKETKVRVVGTESK
jgi:membrane fusion protein (multidrug efflux system)